MARELLLQGFMEHPMLKPLPYEYTRARAPHQPRDRHAPLHEASRRLREEAEGTGGRQARRDGHPRVVAPPLRRRNLQQCGPDLEPQLLLALDAAGWRRHPSGPLKLRSTPRSEASSACETTSSPPARITSGSGWLWLVTRGDACGSRRLPMRISRVATATPRSCAPISGNTRITSTTTTSARAISRAFIDHLVNWQFAGANWSQAAGSAPLLRRAGR